MRAQEMIKEQDKLRTGQKIYHDSVFEEEIKNLINITKEHYEACVSPSRSRGDQIANNPPRI